jgi:carbon-monoxide dehydrogenase small subunit
MEIRFILNGRETRGDYPPDLNLLDLLRKHLGLTGTKCGCDTGNCGVCAVLLDDAFALSCRVRVADLNGREVTTIEGIHAPDGGPNDLQQSFLNHGAVQCGFCIPAMVIAGESLLRRTPVPSRQEIRAAINPVLCRCTGYQQIIDAIEETSEMRNQQTVVKAGG